MNELISADMQKVREILKREGCLEGLDVIGPDDCMISDGGKLLRPRLVSTVARMCGADGVAHVDFAAAIELLHNSTLFHDDVIDSAEMRRGVPSLNKRFGDNFAILAGDHLMARCASIIAGHDRADIVRVVFDCLRDLVFGQLKEMDLERRLDCSLEDYYLVIDNKTASLLRTCVVAGAMAARADDSVTEKLDGIAAIAGRLFQVADDVLDYICDEKKTGKRQFQDVREGKMTLPAMLMLKQCTGEEKESFRKCFGDKKLSNEQGLEILECMNKYRVFEEIKRDYAAEHEKMKRMISQLEENEFRPDFEELMQLVVGRLYGWIEEMN